MPGSIRGSPIRLSSARRSAASAPAAPHRSPPRRAARRLPALRRPDAAARFLRHRAGRGQRGPCCCCSRWPAWRRRCRGAARPRSHLSTCSAASPPGASHRLGTDELGRDLLLRLLYGGRVSLFVGLIVAVAAAVIGTLLGCSPATRRTHRRAADAATDGVIALPLLPLLIVLAAIDLTKLGCRGCGARRGASLYRIAVIISLVSWTTVARLVRGATLSLREREFVRAA